MTPALILSLALGAHTQPIPTAPQPMPPGTRHMAGYGDVNWVVVDSPEVDELAAELAQFEWARKTVRQSYMAVCHRQSGLAEACDWNPDSNRLAEAAHDAKWVYRCWDALDDAFIVSFSTGQRRERLEELRRLIGDTAFFAGLMPDTY